MDWLHVKASIVSKGKSAVAASAYQSRSTLKHEQQRAFSTGIEHRKGLNKGMVSDNLRAEFQKNGMILSDTATAQKNSRYQWTITDKGKTYTVREYTERKLNPETRKREIRSQSLDIYADKTYNYTTREDLKADWIQAGNDAPEWIGQVVRDNDRQTYWNRAVSGEQRNAQTAYKLEFALSRDLDLEQNKAFVRDWVNKQYVSKGAVVDVAIHDNKASDGGSNPHCHLLVGTRVATEDGFANEKNPNLDSYHHFHDRAENLHSLRASLAQTMNAHLQAAGKEATINPESFAKRGVNKEPTKHRGIGEGVHRRESEIRAENHFIQTRNTVRLHLVHSTPMTPQQQAAWAMHHHTQKSHQTRIL